MASEKKLFLGQILLTLFIPTVSLKRNAFFLGRIGVVSGRKTSQSKEHWALANTFPAIELHLHNPCKKTPTTSICPFDTCTVGPPGLVLVILGTHNGSLVAWKFVSFFFILLCCWPGFLPQEMEALLLKVKLAQFCFVSSILLAFC